jgi:dGTPase
MHPIGAVTLSRFASDPVRSRGRRFAEPSAPTRNDFQRDRDRVIHSSAFRRLVYKTQVFFNHEGDLFRTRLTHSLEVAQLARSIARCLGLHEDLVEAVALAHDLGHTPFGHAGQDALNDCLLADEADKEAGHNEPRGGFEHNLQSLRVVDALEERYPAFNGLNLSFETREGILKHCSRANALWLETLEPNGVGARFLNGQSPSLEAQLTNLADEIAYNAHDIDDGVRSGLLSLEQMLEVAIFREHALSAQQESPALQGRRWLAEAIRRMLSAQVYDVISSSKRAIADAGVETLDDVRQHKLLLQFSEPMQTQIVALKRFLMRNLYRHPQVMDMTQRGRQVVTDLYAAYTASPQEMPLAVLHSAQVADIGVRRCVADYIAGMTDRFAIREHRRLTGLHLF